METLLNHLMNALPIMAELTSAIPRPVERDLQTQVPHMVWVGFSFLTSVGVVEFLKNYGPQISGVFLTIFGVVLAVRSSHSSQEVNTVIIELGKIKVGWNGVAALGCIVAGILLIASSINPTTLAWQ